ECHDAECQADEGRARAGALPVDAEGGERGEDDTPADHGEFACAEVVALAAVGSPTLVEVLDEGRGHGIDGGGEGANARGEEPGEHEGAEAGGHLRENEADKDVFRIRKRWD